MYSSKIFILSKMSSSGKLFEKTLTIVLEKDQTVIMIVTLCLWVCDV